MQRLNFPTEFRTVYCEITEPFVWPAVYKGSPLHSGHVFSLYARQQGSRFVTGSDISIDVPCCISHPEISFDETFLKKAPTKHLDVIVYLHSIFFITFWVSEECNRSDRKAEIPGNSPLKHSNFKQEWKSIQVESLKSLVMRYRYENIIDTMIHVQINSIQRWNNILNSTLIVSWKVSTAQNKHFHY